MAEGFTEDIDQMSEELASSLSVTVIMCDPCLEDGIYVHVSGFCVECNDYLCSECIDIHKKARPSRHHTVKDKASMPKHKPVIKKQEMCNIHKNEPLSWVCETHDVVICNLCRAADHRKCKEVKTLAEASKNTKSSGKLSEVQGRLKKLEKDFEAKLSIIHENKELILEIYNRTVNSIIAHLSKIKKNDQNLMEDLQSTCETSLSTVKSLIEGMSSQEEDACSLEHLFLVLKKAESQFRTFELRLAQIHNDNVVTRYRFVEGNTERNDGLLGQICDQQYKPVARKIRHINVKTDSDTQECWIAGMDLLDDNRLAVADRDNSKIKLIDLINKTVSTEAKLDIPPWDLTNIDNNLIACTQFITGKEVVVMSVTDKFQIKHRINKNARTHGIAKENGNLWVSLHSPDGIHLVGRDGSLQKVINNRDSKYNVIFEDPYQLATNENSDEIYISENKNNKVIRMNKNGEVLSAFTHKDLVSPRGISVGRDGRVFVCSWNKNMIFEIDQDLSNGRTIFSQQDGISKPYSLVYDDVKSVLYVGNYTGVSDHQIQVFQV